MSNASAILCDVPRLLHGASRSGRPVWCAHRSPGGFCRGRRCCCGIAPAARCCIPTGPSCTWRRALCPGEEPAEWAESPGLSGQTRGSSSHTDTHAGTDPKMHSCAQSATSAFTSRDVGRGLESVLLSDRRVGVDHDEGGLLAAQTLGQLQGAPSALSGANRNSNTHTLYGCI